MKETRLKTLNDCLSAIHDAHDVLEEVRDEEQDAFDNMPGHNIISRSFGSGDFVFGNDAASLNRTGLCKGL